MSMLKVIEILAESPNSWEEAAQSAVKQASETLRDIKSIYIENFEAQVDNDRIVSYRVNGKVTFRLEK